VNNYTSSSSFIVTWFVLVQNLALIDQKRLLISFAAIVNPIIFASARIRCTANVFVFMKIVLEVFRKQFSSQYLPCHTFVAELPLRPHIFFLNVRQALSCRVLKWVNVAAFAAGLWRWHTEWRYFSSSSPGAQNRHLLNGVRWRCCRNQPVV